MDYTYVLPYVVLCGSSSEGSIKAKAFFEQRNLESENTTQCIIFDIAN